MDGKRFYLIFVCLFIAIVTIDSIKQTKFPIRDCQISEFMCNNRRCVSAEKYCDSIDDCGDGSDEPRFCSKCNRTYHGNVGVTYHMELHRPKEDKLPFACQLTFTADGGMYGDIVQITIKNGFTLGKFVSFTRQGCPDGYLEFNEADRVSVGGRFCGQSWGPAVFYSETRTLVLSVKLFKLLRVANTYNFDFRIDYKFLSKEESIVRYGGGILMRPSMIFNESFINMLNNFNNNKQLQRHNTHALDFDNKLNSINMKTKAFDVYQEEFQSRINNWYDTSLNYNLTLPFNTHQQQQQQQYNQYQQQQYGNNGQQYGTSKSNSNLLNSAGIPVQARGDNSKQRSKLYSKMSPFREVKYYLGDLIPGTYCSRIFSNCDKKLCRLQSPNFPGTYPRNLTCYYAIRQHEIPQGKHALITVRQPKNNLVWIIAGNQTYASKTSDNGKPRQKLLQTWDECDVIQDFVQVYNGYTTRDPVLLKFCGGGQAIPRATSSGPELLVEFTSSPFGTFNNLQPDSNLQAFNGFQLEVEVSFVDINSPTFSKSKSSCEFWIRGTGHGTLENPYHSIAPNTTCLYHFQGTELLSRTMDQLYMPLRKVGSYPSSHSRYKIWFSMLKFDYAPIPEPFDENMLLQPLREDCTGMLRIFDAQLREPPNCKDLDCLMNEREQRLSRYGQNSTNVIARFCRGSVPRSCDHVIQNVTISRPCTLQESFLSTGEYATLELKITESTALRPLNFKLNYEFVDLNQDGAPIDGNDLSCNRKFVSTMETQNDPMLFRGNRNIFSFGRSGNYNMNCVYRFEAQRGEKIRITVHRMMSGNRTCESRIESDTQRSFCYGNNTAKLQIFERPWHDSVLFIRNCICNSTNSSSIFPFTYTSTSREVEVHFTAVNMTKYDDPDNLNFQATFEFIKPTLTTYSTAAPTYCKETKRKIGSEGTISLNDGDYECKARPWLIEPTTGKYLYLSFRGYYLSRYNPQIPIPLNTSMNYFNTRPDCPTHARVIITTGDSVTVTACPLSDDYSNRHQVEVFSAGWAQKNQFQRFEASPALSIEFIPDIYDYNEYLLTWLELSRRPPIAEGIEDCQFSCPELGACVNASIWCDGKVHCPSGSDESFIFCSRLLLLPAEALAVLSVLLIVLLCGLAIYVRRKIRRHCQGSSVLQKRLKSVSSVNTNTDTAVFDDKDFIS